MNPSSSSSSFFDTVFDSVQMAADHLGKAMDDVADQLWGESATGRGSDDATRSGTEESFGDAGDETMEDEDFVHPLDGISESVMGDIFSKQSGPQTTWEHFQAFRSAVNWTEPVIIGLIVFNVFMLLVTVYMARHKPITAATSKQPEPIFSARVVYLIVVGCLVYSLQTINTWCGRHWESLATQNYFDPKGTFISIFLGAPLILMVFGLLVAHVREASQLLVQVKKMEITAKKKNKNKGKDAKRDKKDKQSTNTSATSSPTTPDESKKSQ